jgi:NhaP-type Na+/H+ or K+/H+ antiporter
VLGSSAPRAEEIVGIAALAVFASIIVHGLTDHPGSEWMARHAERESVAA